MMDGRWDVRVDELGSWVSRGRGGKSEVSLSSASCSLTTMSSPSPTLALARRFGASLGLTEGLDGPTTLRMSPRAYGTFVDAVSAPPCRRSSLPVVLTEIGRPLESSSGNTS